MCIIYSKIRHFATFYYKASIAPYLAIRIISKRANNSATTLRPFVVGAELHKSSSQQQTKSAENKTMAFDIPQNVFSVIEPVVPSSS
jgi:hypothetical protein